MTYELFDYQTKLVNQARQALAAGKKSILLVSPAGSGKSVIIADIVRLTTKNKKRVMFTVHRQELIRQIIQDFNRNDVDMNYVTIMTVGKIANRLTKLPKPDLIITDETHHSRASTYRKIYDYYNNVPRLGFTATPWRMNGVGFDDIYDEMIEGLSVAELIAKGNLAPYKYYSVKLLDESKLAKSSTGDYTNKSIDNAIGKTIFGDVVNTWKDKAFDQQTIIYAHDIEYSKQVVQAFNEAGINALHCDSKTPQGKRDKIMNDFKSGDLKVLSNVDLISEGFNVPDCSCVIMLRPTQSLVLFIQQSMRCMRFKPNKVATIIDHVGNYTRFGMPDTKQEWSLQGWKKAGKKRVKSDAIGIWECLECHAMNNTGLTHCEVCGWERPNQDNNMDVDEHVEIEQVGGLNMTTDYTMIKYAKMKPEQATNKHDLAMIAKARGYKSGWAWFQAKKLGFK